MTTWQSGRESALLDDIIAGRKTIEGRLNRGKFAKYKPGDIVQLRRVFRDEHGVLRDGEPNVATVEVVAVRPYTTFLEMCSQEDFRAIIPSAHSADEAAAVYDSYYSKEDQLEYGVLAIEVRNL